MALVKNTVILLVVLISFTCAQNEKPTETPIDSSSVDPTTTTPASTTTPTTTTPTPSTSTTTEPTTTVAPTTEPPTTPPTTTVAPTTTTTSPPTTTPRPKPSPPDFKKFHFTDSKTNLTCVIVQFALQINLTYATADGNTSNVLYNIPVNDANTSTGSCGNDSQSITIEWGPKSTESQLELQFALNATTSMFSLSEIALSINASNEFSDAKAGQIITLYHEVDNFTTPVAMSYHCNKIQTLDFTNAKDGKEIVANATVSHLQLEAFQKKNNDQFATAQDCEAIDTPDIVPIAVGCALAALVIIVLIAYLIGRRRRQARGYLSM